MTLIEELLFEELAGIIQSRRVAGPHVQYVRDYMPGRQEILIFAGAYLCLRRGSRARAALDLAALNLSSAPFVDPWEWRTATTDDPQERLRYLQRATAQDVAHPLARDALALAEWVQRVLLDPAAAARMGATGRALAEANYRRERVGRQYLAMLRYIAQMEPYSHLV